MVDDQMLIDLVRRNEILYDKTFGGYRNPVKKKAVWASIAQELGAPEELCMKRWTTIRERYSRECKRLETPPTGSTASYCEPWPLLGSLYFLKDHVKPRTKSTFNFLEESLCSPIQTSSLPSASPKLEYSVGSPKTEYTEVLTKMEYEVESPKLDYSSSTEKYSDEPKASTSTERVKKRKANSSHNFDELFQEARSSYQAICQERLNEKKNVAVHAFGKMIVATICELSARKQTQAMKQITDIVMTLRLEEEEERNYQSEN